MHLVNEVVFPSSHPCSLAGAFSLPMTAQPYPEREAPATSTAGNASMATAAYGVEVCAHCAVRNRVDARFCRGCRAPLTANEAPEAPIVAVGPVELLALRGSFRRAPVKAGGLLYLLASSGAVSQFSPGAGAVLRPMGQLRQASAGFNRFAVLDLAGPKLPGALRGWTLLAAETAGIEALSFVTGESTLLFQPAAPEQMAVNHSDLDGTGFKGLAATLDLCAFLTFSPPDGFTLNLLSLAADRPIERPLTLFGNAAAGVALCGAYFVFCTDTQVGRFHAPSRKAQSLNLPTSFKPLLTPSSPELTIALGGMPFVAQAFAHTGETMLLAGTQGDRAGVLQIDFERNHAEFRALPRASALATGAEGNATLRTGDGVDVFGGRAASLSIRTQPGMPVFQDGETLFPFAESDFARRHQVVATRAGGKVDLRFEDTRCDRYSCCGAYAFAHEFVVAYLDLNSADGAEMVLARWPYLLPDSASGGAHA